MPDSQDAIPTSAGFGLNHLGLAVADLEKAHDFYVNVVGMAEEGQSEVSSEAFDTLMGGKGLHIKFWYLNLNGFRLQIVEYVNGAGEQLGLQHNKGGCPHLCFEVPNAQEKYDEIKARGDVRILSEVVTSQYGPMVAYTFYVADPDGVPVEFAQVEQAA